MIYEVEVAQTVKGKIFIKADSQKEADTVGDVEIIKAEDVL